MTKPQQPELRRSGLGETDQDSWVPDPHDHPGGGGEVGPVPEDNQPGHRPDVEQDKPDLDAFAEALGTHPGGEEPDG